ncbi:MAG: hypothetical protein LBB90_10455 [Tannerella sp.]|jgi:hypothetical protein|nr:hypothetical protein [Tannerella sp.]
MRFVIHASISGLDELYRGATAITKQKIIDRLHKIGEKFVNHAKNTGTYEDRTSNLRNANSYRIYRDGVMVREFIGRPKTGKIFEELKSGIGIEAFFGNGMEYASFVEGKGYNVVTAAFMWVESEIKKQS